MNTQKVGNRKTSIKFNYKVTPPNGKDEYCRTVNDGAKRVSISLPTFRKMLKTGETIRGFKAEKLDTPFVFDVPNKGDKLTIQKVKCTVINVYERTFSVMTDYGNRLVKIEGMTFVDNTPDEYVRQRKLAIKNY